MQHRTIFVPTTGANAPVRAGTQGLTFNRRSTVSLAGGWGELRLGRDYTPTFWNLTIFDAFGTNGLGSSTNPRQVYGGTRQDSTQIRHLPVSRNHFPACEVGECRTQ